MDVSCPFCGASVDIEGRSGPEVECPRCRVRFEVETALETGPSTDPGVKSPESPGEKSTKAYCRDDEPEADSAVSLSSSGNYGLRSERLAQATDVVFPPRATGRRPDIGRGRPLSADTPRGSEPLEPEKKPTVPRPKGKDVLKGTTGSGHRPSTEAYAVESRQAMADLKIPVRRTPPKEFPSPPEIPGPAVGDISNEIHEKATGFATGRFSEWIESEPRTGGPTGPIVDEVFAGGKPATPPAEPAAAPSAGADTDFQWGDKSASEASGAREVPVPERLSRVSEYLPPGSALPPAPDLSSASEFELAPPRIGNPPTTSLLDGLDLSIDPLSSSQNPVAGASAPVAAPDLDAVLSDNLLGEASLSWTQPPVSPSPGESANAPFPKPEAAQAAGREPSGTDWMVEGLNLDLSLPDMTGESVPTGRMTEPTTIPEAQGTGAQEAGPGMDLDLSGPTATGGLELDIGEGRARAEPTGDAGPSAVVGPTSLAGSPSIAPIVAVARKGAKTAKRGMPKPLLAGVTLVCLVGVILGQTEYGYFGINLLFPPQSGRGGGPRPAAFRSGAAVGTGLDGLLKEVDRLENQLQQDPENATLREELLDVLLRISERYPNQVAATPKFMQRLRELQTQTRPDGTRSGRLAVVALFQERKFDEARKALEGMLATTPQDPDILFLLGRAALGQDKPEEAQRFLEQSLQTAPGVSATKYFLGRALLAAKQTARAKGILEEVIADEPDHIGARAALALTGIAAKDYETAAKYAKEVISRGNSTQWREEAVLAHEALAEVYLARNEPAKRLDELVAALAIQPDREETAVTVARLYQEAQKRDQSLAVLEPCREKGCESEEFLRTYATMAFLNDREEAAEKALKEGGEKYPKSPGFALLRAQHQLDLDRPRVAVAALEDALKIEASCEEAYVLLSKALMKDGKLGAAVDRLKAGLEQVKDQRPLLAALADVHKAKRDYPAAEAVLRKLLGFGGAEARVQQALGLVVASQGRSGEAVRILAALEARGSLDREGILGLADALLAINEKQRAYEVLAKLYGRNENDPVVGSAYGHALAEGGKPQQAEEVLRKVIELSPSFSQAHYNLGRLFRKTGEKAKAVEALTRAVQIENANTVYRLELARAHLDLGTVEGRKDARSALDAVVTAYGRGDVPQELQDADVYVLRGKMQFEEQKYGLAMKDFESALTLAPSRLDVMVSFGRSLFEMARYQEAEPYFRQVLVRDAMHPEANYYLGRIRLREHDSEGAKTHLTRSVQRDVRLFPDAHRLLGLLYNDQGIRPLARKELEIYVSLAQKGTPEYEEAKGILDRMR